MSPLTAAVSVVLATYNGAQYLPKQLASLSQQSLLPAEVVVGDDGSTDATMGIVEDFARWSPFPVRLVVRRRLGCSDNFLATAALAKGDLLAFCDQDDVWHPDKLERVVQAFASSPEVCLVAHRADLVDRYGSPLGRVIPKLEHVGRYPRGTQAPPAFPGFSLTVRRQLLGVADAGRRPDHGDARVGLMGHDSWLWMLAACTGELVVLADALVSYRQHENLFGNPYVGISERLRRSRMADAETYLGRARIESGMADYIETLASGWHTDGHGAWSESARKLAAQHRASAGLAVQRANLYRSSNRGAALYRWGQMVLSGVYANHGQEGSAALSAGKDALWSAAGAGPRRRSASSGR